jgi:hypothetical protein
MAIVIVSVSAARDVALYNDSTSIPRGFYVRDDGAPLRGAIVTVRAVDVAPEYARLRHYTDLDDRLIKRIAAGTVIERFTYDDGRQELVVVFRSGRAYVFHDVSADMAAALRGALAKGEFFNAEIRDRYRFTRLAPIGESVRKVSE